MFGPDPTAITASTGTGPSMHAASSDAQNSARTVPPCTYPITQWSATARLVPGVEVVPLLDGFLRRRVRVVPVAHHERRPVHREAPDAPAPRLMAVVPPRVHPRVRQQAPGDHQDAEDPGVEVVERAAVRAEIVRQLSRCRTSAAPAGRCCPPGRCPSPPAPVFPGSRWPAHRSATAPP